MCLAGAKSGMTRVALAEKQMKNQPANIRQVQEPPAHATNALSSYTEQGDEGEYNHEWSIQGDEESDRLVDRTRKAKGARSPARHSRYCY